MSCMLETDALTKTFKGQTAVDRCSLQSDDVQCGGAGRNGLALGFVGLFTIANL